jgi:hypothetical protein
MLATVFFLYVVPVALGILAIILSISIGGLPLSIVLVSLQTWILAYLFGNPAIKFKDRDIRAT